METQFVQFIALFKTYNLIYSHKYSKKNSLEEANVAENEEEQTILSVLMQMINVLNIQRIQLGSIRIIHQ